MSTLKGEELLRRIACLKRVIRKLTTSYVYGGTEKELADLDTLEQMILDMGGQVHEVPYSKSKLKRLQLDTEFDTYDIVQHRDVEDIRTDPVKGKPVIRNKS